MLLGPPSLTPRAQPSGLPGLKGLVTPGAKGRRISGPPARVAYVGTPGAAPLYTSQGITIPPVSGANSEFTYLTPAMLPRSGRWYWEARPTQSVSWFLWGLAIDISPLAYGGYTTVNCGYYSIGSVWAGSGMSIPIGWNGPAVGLSDTLGFLYNSDAGQFDTSVNGVPNSTITNVPPTPAYALFAFQGLGVTADVRLGKDNVLYPPAPPASLKFLGFDA